MKPKRDPDKPAAVIIKPMEPPPGFRFFTIGPEEMSTIPLCNCGSYMTTETLEGEWLCRWCEPERARERGERTIGLLKARAKILQQHGPTKREIK
jgi:hypothetical protein